MRIERHAHGSWVNAAAFIDELAYDFERSLLTEALADPRPLHDPMRELTDVLTRLRNGFLDRELARLGQQLVSPDASEEDKARILQEQQALRLQKRQPLQPPPAA